MNIPEDFFILRKEWDLKFRTVVEINKTCRKLGAKVNDGYVRPVAWRGSEMMAISAQQTKFMLLLLPGHGVHILILI